MPSMRHAEHMLLEADVEVQSKRQRLGGSPCLGALAACCCAGALALVVHSSRSTGLPVRAGSEFMEAYPNEPAGTAAMATSDPAPVPGSPYLTNAGTSATFAWTAPTQTVEAAMQTAFPGGRGWNATTFTEGGGGAWTLSAVAAWVNRELLGGVDPFAAHGGQVPVPHTAPKAQGGKFPTPRDQLEPGQWVAYSRRQVCFIVAKSLTGAGTAGYQNGLVRFMHKAVGGRCTPSSGDFGKAWWGLLAACAADPTLKGGAQGPLLIAAKARDPPTMAEIRAKAEATYLSSAGLRTCFYDDGGAGAGLPGTTPVPEMACRQPSPEHTGLDFMNGRLMGQATQDISANFLGGYIYGNACGLGGGQDERLMVYYPEVSALTFFLSEAGPDGVYGPPQLRQPAWILGARRLRYGLDGTCKFENEFVMDPYVPFTSDLANVRLQGRDVQISRSKPFLAFMSINQGFLGWPEARPALQLARRNKNPKQRDVSVGGQYAFEQQVLAWYRSVALTSYDTAVQPVLRAVVSSLGSGPWGAGLWWGDSQLSFAASWIGHALAATTWGQLPLDYYVYAAFTENPGNQCLIHGPARCAACMQRCNQVSTGQQHAYWLPGEAFRTVGNANPCASTSEDCGQHGLAEVLQTYQQKTAGSLWHAVESSMGLPGAEVTSSAFDLLLSAR